VTEMRCYIRDPDGYIIEVGQTTLQRGWEPPSRATDEETRGAAELAPASLSPLTTNAGRTA